MTPFRHIWLYISSTDLETEQRQCSEEGKDLATLADEITFVSGLDLEQPENQRAAQALLDSTIDLPIRADFPYREPSDLEGIRDARVRDRRSRPRDVRANTVAGTMPIR